MKYLQIIKILNKLTITKNATTIQNDAISNPIISTTYPPIKGPTSILK